MAAELIYVVEDDGDIRDLSCRALREYGYAVEGFHNGTSAKKAIQRCRPDLLVVDLGLPDMDGMSLVRELSENARIGVIIVTGRGSLSDRVLGLEVGADDYLTKPFEPRELVARAASVLRRLTHVGEIAQSKNTKARFAGWFYDHDVLGLTSPDGETQTLSAAEAQLLMALLHSPNRVLSRDQLLGDAPRGVDHAFDRSIDVRVSRLRSKLQPTKTAPKLIKTVYGVGYLLACEVDWG